MKTFDVTVCACGEISVGANTQEQAEEKVREAMQNMADGRATDFAIVRAVESCIKAHLYAGDINVS